MIGAASDLQRKQDIAAITAAQARLENPSPYYDWVIAAQKAAAGAGLAIFDVVQV